MSHQLGDTDPPRDDTNTAFARRVANSLRYYRRERGISLSELSRRSGVAKGTLSRLEFGDGNPTVMTLAALATELGVTPSDFFSDGDESSTPPPNLAGPGIRMRFISRIRTTSIWEIYETTIPHLDQPLYSDLHKGTEHLLLLSGEALVGSPDDPVLLRPGEHTSFPGDAPHMYWSKSGPSHVLLMMDYPLED
jgi:transcriptional regulator with XRE-family HTH domain